MLTSPAARVLAFPSPTDSTASAALRRNERGGRPRWLRRASRLVRTPRGSVVSAVGAEVDGIPAVGAAEAPSSESIQTAAVTPCTANEEEAAVVFSMASAGGEARDIDLLRLPQDPSPHTPPLVALEWWLKWVGASARGRRSAGACGAIRLRRLRYAMRHLRATTRKMRSLAELSMCADLGMAWLRQSRCLRIWSMETARHRAEHVLLSSTLRRRQGHELACALRRMRASWQRITAAARDGASRVSGGGSARTVRSCRGYGRSRHAKYLNHDPNERSSRLCSSALMAWHRFAREGRQHASAFRQATQAQHRCALAYAWGEWKGRTLATHAMQRCTLAVATRAMHQRYRVAFSRWATLAEALATNELLLRRGAEHAWYVQLDDGWQGLLAQLLLGRASAEMAARACRLGAVLCERRLVRGWKTWCGDAYMRRYLVDRRLLQRLAFRRWRSRRQAAPHMSSDVLVWTRAMLARRAWQMQSDAFARVRDIAKRRRELSALTAGGVVSILRPLLLRGMRRWQAARLVRKARAVREHAAADFARRQRCKRALADWLCVLVSSVEAEMEALGVSVNVGAVTPAPLPRKRRGACCVVEATSGTE